jgi:hypothetical protein
MDIEGLRHKQGSIKMMKISIRISNPRIQSRNIMTAIHSVNNVNPFTIRNGVVRGIAAICKGINLLKS